jgi:hypothetical protein
MRFQHAPDAYPVYKHIFVTHQQLAKLLVDHPAMRPNLQQTDVLNPCEQQESNLLHMGFVLRTFQFLAAQVDLRDPHSSPMFRDVMGRVLQTKLFTVDQTGILKEGNASLRNKDDDGAEFTDEIRKLANTLDDFTGCAACQKEEQEDGKALLLCARCKKEKSCSTDCQKKRWQSHKRFCKPASANS